jgi:lambda repressor-like predicted transcriptional regulator
LAKADETDKKRMAIIAAHTKRGTTSIGLAQRGRNAAYSLGLAFNRTIKRLIRTSMSALPYTPSW